MALDRMLRRSEVEVVTGLSRSAIYETNESGGISRTGSGRHSRCAVA